MIFQCKYIERFEEKKAPEKEMKDIIKDIWFHDPYTYNYASTSYYGIENENKLLLPFFCFKFDGKKLSEWESIGYEDPMVYLEEKLLCKTTIHDLSSTNPLSTINLIEKINQDISGVMKPYTELTNSSILAPIYVIIVQYPNKFHYDNHGSKGYDYTKYGVASENVKPYERKNASTGEIKYSCINNGKGMCETRVDTRMMIVYPMYDKTKVSFYPELCEKYRLKKLPESIKLFPKKTEEEKTNENQPNVKGIVDMIKKLNETPLKITKHQNCFIECNNTSKYYCGCGTRINGVDDPMEEKEGNYKSFCKEPKTDKGSEELFTHYLLMYRINELHRRIDNLTNIELDVDSEKLVTKALDTNIC